MPVKYESSTDGKEVLITIVGCFDYKATRILRDCYCQNYGHEDVIYKIDLSCACSIDSSALGMLLLLREDAKNHGGVILIERPGEEIDRALRMSEFDRLFIINSNYQTARDNHYYANGMYQIIRT